MSTSPSAPSTGFDVGTVAALIEAVVGPALAHTPGSQLVTWQQPLHGPGARNVERWTPDHHGSITAMVSAAAAALVRGGQEHGRAFDLAPLAPDARLPEGKRGSAEHRAPRFAFHFDLDHGDAGGHNASAAGAAGYPSKARALELIEALPVAPSWLVDSGGGFHAYFLVDDPISDPRQQLASIRAWWEQHVAPHPPDGDVITSATTSGKAPGCWRRKTQPAMPVCVISAPDHRYRLEDLIAAMPGPAPAPTPRRRTARPRPSTGSARVPGQPGGRLGPLWAAPPVPLSIDTVLGVLGWEQVADRGDQHDWQSPTSGVAGTPSAKSATVYPPSEDGDDETVTIFDTLDQEALGLDDAHHALPAREMLLVACCDRDLGLAERLLRSYAAAQDGVEDPAEAADAWVTAHLDACADEDPAVFAAALRQLFPPAADPDPDLAAAGGEASRRFDLEALREAGPVSIRVPGSGWASVHIDLERGAVRLLKQREKGEEVIDTEVAPWAAFRLRRHTTLHRGHAVGDPTYDVIVLAGGRHSTVCGLSDSESLSPEVLRDRTGLPVTDPAPADRHVVRNMILGCFDHEEVQIHGCTGWVTDLDGGHRFLGTQGSITASGLDVEVAARVAGTAENEFAANHGWPIVASETDPAPALRDVVAAVQKVTPGRPEVGLALLAAPFAALLEGDGVVVGLEAAPGVGKTLIAQVPSAFTSFDPERSVDGKGAHVVLTSNKLTVKAVEVRQAALRGITMHCDDLKVSGDKARDTRSREIAGSMVEAYFGGGGGDEMRLNSGAEMRQSAGLEASGAGVLTGETMEVLSPSTRDRVIVLQMRRGDVDTVAGGGVDRWHTLVRRGAPQAVHLAVTRWVAEQLDAGSNGFFARETGVVGVGGMRAWVRRHRSAGTITREVVKAAVLEAGLRLLMAWEAACVPEGARVLDDDLVGSTMRSIAAQSAAAAQEATLAQQVVRGLRDALESGTGYLTRSQDEGVPVEPRMLGWAWADGPGANWVSRGRSLGRASYDYRNVLVTFDALRRVLAGSPLAEKTPAEIRRAMAEVAVNARNGDVPERLHTADLHLVFGPDARAPQVRGVVLPASLLGLGHIAQLAAELDEAAVKEVH